MSILLPIAIAALHLQTSAVDPAGILAAALDRLMPTRPPSASAPIGRANLANRKLFLDVARTASAFRSLDPGVSADYATIGRPFVSRSYAEAVPCSGALNCGIEDDGVYAAITSVKTDAVNSYIVELLLYFNGQGPQGPSLHGTETEMFVSLDKNGRWKVDRIGKIRAIN